jgi:hypothetical protein
MMRRRLFSELITLTAALARSLVPHTVKLSIHFLLDR